jgi:pimeloyl-ACP methyl ester carboxylesterase
MSTITLPDRSSLYLKDWGSGPAVVLMAGWPLSADSWDELALTLASSGYRTLAYDRRGFGRSSQPWGGYDYDNLADDLATVLQRTEVSDATLVGFSMGGGEVARYLSRHAGRGVGKAALIASVVPGRVPSDAEGLAKYEKLAGLLQASTTACSRSARSASSGRASSHCKPACVRPWPARIPSAPPTSAPTWRPSRCRR